MTRRDTTTIDGVRRAATFGRDPLGFLDELRGPGPALVDATVGVGPSLTFVTEPELVRQVLVADDERYRRPDVQTGRTIQLTQNGLIESEGPLWEAQRSRLMSLFAPDRIAEYADTIGEVVADRTGDWEVGDDLDLYDEMTAITVRVIAQTLFSTELEPEETARFAAANATIGQEFELSPLTIFRQFVPTPPSSEYRAAVSDLHEWADGLIADRRAMDDRPEDLVTTMLRAEADPDVDLPPNQVRDEVLTFLFAGHETTALTLAYALWFTAATDGVAERVRAEARAVLDGRSVPDWDDLSDLEYTEQVIREAIRLRTPSWGIFRQAKLDSRLGDARIEGEDYLLLPQWTLHRDARFFDQPERFDPARWDNRDPSTTPAYFPFGAGPHACIGRQLALTEAQLVLAALLARFDFDVNPGTIDELRPAGVLQPRGGVPATVRLP